MGRAKKEKFETNYWNNFFKNREQKIFNILHDYPSFFDNKYYNKVCLVSALEYCGRKCERKYFKFENGAFSIRFKFKVGNYCFEVEYDINKNTLKRVENVNKCTDKEFMASYYVVEMEIFHKRLNYYNRGGRNFY